MPSKRDENPPKFSLRPTHTAEVDTYTPLFTRPGSGLSYQYPYTYNMQNEHTSPLPTSALPYIYAEDDDAQIMSSATTPTTPSSSSPTSHTTIKNTTIPKTPPSAVSSTIYPPMYTPEHEKPVNHKTYRVPSASKTFKAAVVKNNSLTHKKSKMSNHRNSHDNDDDDHDHDHHYHSINTNIITATKARQQLDQHHGMNSTQTLENRRTSLLSSSDSGFSVRVVTSQSKIDPSGADYTVYIMCIETKGMNMEDDGERRYNIEHRYSEFAKLYADLIANDIVMESEFPSRHWAGRIGDWTPSSWWAPDTKEELIRTREKMLDIWMVELCEKFQQTNLLHGELRTQVDTFLRNSSASIPPCDRPNHISLDGLCLNGDLVDLDGESMIEFEGEARHSGGGAIIKYVGNPMSFTLGSSIRQAAYTVMRMCGTSNTYSLNGDKTDQLIPLDLLHQARGLCFLTVVKAGFVVSVRGGTGLIIAKRRDGTWTPPTAIGTLGMGWGALIGGDITNYLIVLNTEQAVKAFAQNRSVSLGAELDVAVGPLGRGANGNLNAGSTGKIAPAYSYAHSKGLFAGISLEGSIVGSRPDVNAKFYGKPIEANDLLFENMQPRPFAAQPLYDALNEAMNLDVPTNGFRPSSILKSGNSYFS